LLVSLIKKLAQSPLIKNSAILWVGMMAANMSNYLFHLLMGRFLGPVDYGVLASLISVFYFLTVPTVTVLTAVMKYSAEYQAEGNLAKVNGLYKDSTKWLGVTGLVLFVIFAAASPWISRFLNIPTVTPVIMLSLVIPVAYIIPINRGIMQGLESFGQLSINYSLEAILKLVVGLLLVYLGYQVSGAIAGIVLAMFVCYGLSFFPVSSLLRKSGTQEVHLKNILKYSFSVFLALLCLSSYFSVDVILVKHFLSATNAGYYSGLSILGKIVVFASMAIVSVMFPIVTSLHTKDQEHSHYLLYTLSLVSLVSGVIVVAYFVAPSLIIHILFGQKYAPMAPYIGIFGVAMLFLALSSALINYYLAIHQTRFVPLLVVLAILQVVLISWFHSSIKEVTLVMIAVMFLLLASMAAYYFIAVAGKGRIPEPETTSGGTFLIE
jgi:O-antigen/teichoic acid export membrane protein